MMTLTERGDATKTRTAMKLFASTFAVVVLSWSALPASAECNRPEYGALSEWLAPCAKLGVEWQVCRDQFATAKGSVDWVLFESAPALEAYRASVKEQIACGYPPIPLTYQRAVAVAAKAHNALAQCMILMCTARVGVYMQDLEDQGKLPKE
jgi:hypothetical protein